MEIIEFLSNELCAIHFLGRIGGEDRESQYCENKQLSMPTLRMTWEAKNQLKQILVNEVYLY